MVPKANYSVSSLVVSLNSLLTTYGFTFAFVSSSAKLSITNATSYRVYNNLYNINKIIGLDDAVTIFTAGTTVAPNMVNLIGTQMLYVSFPNIAITSFSVKNSSMHSIVASIPIVAVQGDTQVFNGGFKHKISDSVITKVEILIIDEDGNEVLFNNIDWFITMNFIFSYKKSYIEPTLLADLQNVDVNAGL
jgi:hypothetical protein